MKSFTALTDTNGSMKKLLFMQPYLIILCLVLNLLCLPVASATSMLPLSLEQLSTRASLIFYGKVINNEVKKDEQSGRIATFTEFEIIDLIKGETAATHTIKQIGGHLKETGTVVHIYGVPEFVTGKNYVVFLPEKSKLGFSSPLGLHQGSFDVVTVNGQQIVSNGRSLSAQPEQTGRSVQLPLAVTAGNPAQSRLEDFINTVRAYNTP
jgi:hypothetical protein